MTSSRRIKVKVTGTADLSEDVQLSRSDSFLGLLFRQATDWGPTVKFKFVHVPLFWREFSNACFCIGNRGVSP